MAILTTDFASLTDDLQSIFNEVAQTEIAEMVGNKIFKVTDTDRRTFDHLILHGLDVIQAVGQGQDLPATTSVQGGWRKFIQTFFASMVSPCLNSI